jgi:hypothetical protein
MGRYSEDMAEFTAWLAKQPDFDNFALTYGERCRILDMRARLDEARAKINDAQAAYAALLVEAQQFANVVMGRLSTDYPKPATLPSSPAPTAMFKPWFELSYYDIGEHEFWMAQLPVSVVDGQVETVGETPNPPVRPLHLV